jgi:hypothetical protein
MVRCQGGNGAVSGFRIDLLARTRLAGAPVMGRTKLTSCLDKLKPMGRSIRCSGFPLIGENLLNSVDNVGWRIEDLLHQLFQLFAGGRIDIHSAFVRFLDRSRVA